MYDYFISLNCQQISPILGLNETKLHNLIEQAYNFYVSDINGFTGKSKNDKINKNFNTKQIYLIIYAVYLSINLIFLIYYSINLYKKEIYFLERLINFNSQNFDNYLKKLEEIKKN